MIGGLNPSKKQATIIGGGISGMLAAYRLGKQGYEINLYEKGPWLGGLLGTTRYSYGIVERAAHSLRASKPVLQLCDEIAVELLPLRGKSTSYIYRDKTFTPFPFYMGEILGMLARMATKPARNAEENLQTFGHHHLGKAATDYLLTPMAFGVYGARPSELAMPHAFPRLAADPGRNLLSHLITQKFKQRHTPMVTPKNGMSDLVKKLEKALYMMPNIAIHTNQAKDYLQPAPNMILAVPAQTAAKLIHKEDPHTSELLEKVRYTPLISTTVFIDRNALKRFPGGIGVLIPEIENIPILGVLFNSSSFEHRVSDAGLESLTVLCGGTPHPELLEKTDAELEAHITGALDKLFGLKKPPLKMHITRWKEAIPLYNAHLVLTQKQAHESWCAHPGNILAGNYTGQVSIRGMIEEKLC